MSERWFRLYESLVDDPKVQRLPDRLFKALINVWCIASANDGVLPDIETIAFKLRTKPQQAHKLLGELRSAGLLDDDEDAPGTVRPHNWNGRQFKTDVTDPTAAERMRKYRNNKRNGATGSGVTNPVTVTHPETDTEQREETTSLRSVAKKATRLAADWRPTPEERAFARSQGLSDQDLDREADRFRDFWLGKPGKDGTKADWPATWRNWIRRACEMRGISPAANGKDATEDDWRKRLAFARQQRKWASSRWGPMPNEPGCLVPVSMVELTDGAGWAEWGEAS
jgi:hypothetical protein